MFGFLRSEEPLSQHNFYLISRLCSIVCGCWPQPKRSWYGVLYFWLCFSEVGLGVVGELLYGFLKLDDLIKASEAICPGISKGLCLLKMFSLFAFRKQLTVIIETLRGILAKASGNAKKREILQSWASTCTTWNFLLISTGILTVTAFCSRPLILNLLHWWHEQPSDNLLPFLAYFPDTYPLYPVSYLALVVSGLMAAVVCSATDGFFLCTCCYLSAAFHLLQYDIQYIFSKLVFTERANVQQNVQIRLQLREIVQRHIELRDLCAEISTVLSMALFWHFFLSSLVLGLSILELMLNLKSAGVIFYLTHSLAALTQYFLYCIGGSYVSESSNDVADVIYNTEWYKCDVKTRKMILMILREAQQMKTIEIPFYTVSLAAFNSCLAKAASYVTLLQTFL